MNGRHDDTLRSRVIALRPQAERAIRTCPNCGRPLVERSCNHLCPDPAGGFFLSCADDL